MAQGFCIPKFVAEKLQNAVRNGEFTMDSLWNMTSQERRSTFNKYVDEQTAIGINAGFEEAMVSEQKNALLKWAKKTFEGKDTKKNAKSQKDIIDKIQELNDIGFIKTKNLKGEDITDEASDIFLNDLVETKLGVAVSEEEMRKIAKMTEKLTKLAEDVTEFGTPTIEYFEARREIDDYVNSLVPTNKLKIMSSVIGRANLLANLKSPVVNILGNTTAGILQYAERRLSLWKFSGSNSEYAKNWIKYANQVYAKSGYDITRIMSIESPRKTLGEEIIHSQGEGAIRAISRVYEDIVFKNMLGKPDVFYASLAFADSANLMADKIAEFEGLEGEAKKVRALEIFKDATKIEPDTEEGVKVRTQAKLDSQMATMTNDSTASKISLGVRQVVDIATGDLQLGKQLIPFAKTPANVIQYTLESSPIGLATGIYQLVKAKNDMLGAKSQAEAEMHVRMAVRTMIRAGLGMVLGSLLLALLEPEDFIGAYPKDAKERELMNLKGATPNSIKIGDYWISLDYFGPLSFMLLSGMTWKKSGGSPENIINAGIETTQNRISELPGIQEISDLTSTAAGSSQYKFDPEKLAKDTLMGTIDFFRSRLTPGIVTDIAKMSDEYERETNSDDVLSKFKSNYPGLRKTLPIKTTIYGEEIKTQEPLQQLFFGSRVKEARQGEILDELNRLSQTGNLPSLTNYEYTSSRVKLMKENLPSDQYDKMIQEYQEKWTNDTISKINSTEYKKLPAEEQAEELNKLKTKALDTILKKYNYESYKK